MCCMGLAGLGAYTESQLVGWMELCLRIKANMAYWKSFDKAVEWSRDEHPCWKNYGMTENSATPNMLRYRNP